MFNVCVPASGPQALPQSLRELRAFGVWADRTDFKDGIEYGDHLRTPRY